MIVSNSQLYFANFWAVSWLESCSSENKTAHKLQASKPPEHR